MVQINPNHMEFIAYTASETPFFLIYTKFPYTKFPLIGREKACSSAILIERLIFQSVVHFNLGPCLTFKILEP